MQLKKTITETIEREVEVDIQFPFFGKRKEYSDYTYICAISPEELIEVHLGGTYARVSTINFDSARDILKSEAITMEEFEQKLNTAKKEIDLMYAKRFHPTEEVNPEAANQ